MDGLKPVVAATRVATYRACSARQSQEVQYSWQRRTLANKRRDAQSEGSHRDAPQGGDGGDMFGALGLGSLLQQVAVKTLRLLCLALQLLQNNAQTFMQGRRMLAS